MEGLCHRFLAAPVRDKGLPRDQDELPGLQLCDCMLARENKYHCLKKAKSALKISLPSGSLWLVIPRDWPPRWPCHLDGRVSDI